MNNNLFKILTLFILLFENKFLNKNLKSKSKINVKIYYNFNNKVKIKKSYYRIIHIIILIILIIIGYLIFIGFFFKKSYKFNLLMSVYLIYFLYIFQIINYKFNNIVYILSISILFGILSCVLVLKYKFILKLGISIIFAIDYFRLIYYLSAKFKISIYTFILLIILFSLIIKIDTFKLGFTNIFGLFLQIDSFFHFIFIFIYKYWDIKKLTYFILFWILFKYALLIIIEKDIFKSRFLSIYKNEGNFVFK